MALQGLDPSCISNITSCLGFLYHNLPSGAPWSFHAPYPPSGVTFYLPKLPPFVQLNLSCGLNMASSRKPSWIAETWAVPLKLSVTVFSTAKKDNLVHHPFNIHFPDRMLVHKSRDWVCLISLDITKAMPCARKAFNQYLLNEWPSRSWQTLTRAIERETEGRRASVEKG